MVVRAPIALLVFSTVLLAPCVTPAQCSVDNGTLTTDTSSGNPFSAQLKTEVTNGSGEVTATATNSVARDGRGRVRFDGTWGQVEIRSVGGHGIYRAVPAARLCDAETLRVTDLEFAQKFALFRYFLRVPHERYGERLDPFCRLAAITKSGDLQEQDLGHHPIEGVDAQGIRTMEYGRHSPTDPLELRVTKDTWCSEDLRAIVLESVKQVSNGGERRTAMLSIKRVEPDSSLFEIPVGYASGDAMPSWQAASDQTSSAPTPTHQ